jgi:hypothetical protein
MSRPEPVAARFSFSAERKPVEVRLRHFLVAGTVMTGRVEPGNRVWVHVPGGATEADVVEIQRDGVPVSEARMGQTVGLMLRGGRSLVRITPGTGISDSPNYWLPPPPVDEPVRQEYSGPEALEWLRGNPGESAFASNRFGDTAEAIRFVESLYEAGATRVIINDKNIQDDGDELYADALVVYLPTEQFAYYRVIALCRPEVDREGGLTSDPSEWEELETVSLWWD